LKEIHNRKNFILLIPALNPDKGFVSYLDGLYRTLGLSVVVVNDGSDSPELFEEIRSRSFADVVDHDANLGKGAALKTGLRLIAGKYTCVKVVITLDCDGQHTISDVKKVFQASDLSGNTVTLGSRMFSKSMPIKSRIGNAFSSFVTKLTTGKVIRDTQTGLRAISADLLKTMVSFQSNRFDFEQEALLWCLRNSVSIKEVPIEAVYFNKNRGTNFRSVHDSFRVFSIVIKSLLLNGK